MQLAHHPADLPDLPAPTGAHRLAWSYLLDAVFADAFHAGVQRLQVALPAALQAELEARAALVSHHPPGPAGAPATASFGLAPPRPPDLRSYRLRFGLLAPAPLRRRSRPAGPPAGFELRSSLYVYTLGARLYGLPMRLFNALRRPLAADRALIGLRQAFASDRATPCYYIVETWSQTSG